jgi:NAD(P)-dependent dehydrogenase (short-subunit alcohol dehydrogenase family)
MATDPTEHLRGNHPPIDPSGVFDLSGRTAVVTGASSGLGWRMALVLAHAGATVAVTARRTDRLEALAAEHPSIRPFTADLAVATERERLVTEIESALGAIDVLVNNAGVANPKPIEQETLQDFEAMVEINLTSAWHLTKLFGAGMVAAGRVPHPRSRPAIPPPRLGSSTSPANSVCNGHAKVCGSTQSVRAGSPPK